MQRAMMLRGYMRTTRMTMEALPWLRECGIEAVTGPAVYTPGHRGKRAQARIGLYVPEWVALAFDLGGPSARRRRVAVLAMSALGEEAQLALQTAHRVGGVGAAAQFLVDAGIDIFGDGRSE